MKPGRLPRGKVAGVLCWVLVALVVTAVTPLLCVCQVAQTCLTLCDPTDRSPPGSSVHGILQARILECVAMPFSRGIFPARGREPESPASPALAGRFSTTSTTWETLLLLRGLPGAEVQSQPQPTQPRPLHQRPWQTSTSPPPHLPCWPRNPLEPRGLDSRYYCPWTPAHTSPVSGEPDRQG